MACRKRGWHSMTECEETDKIATSQLRKMKSDLFYHNGRVPEGQTEIMNRNASTSPLLRLPPELRLRIYKFVLGGQQIWIGRNPSETIPDTTMWNYQYYARCEILHHGANFYHFNTMSRSGRGLDLRILRVSRQIFTETALLPYALNKFTFEKDGVRRVFERLVRPGKKLVQKKAIGEYQIMDWPEFQSHLLARGK